MSNFDPVQTGGTWADHEVPGGAAFTTWDRNLAKTINAEDGSTHAPTAPVQLGGQGVEILAGAPFKVLGGGAVTIDGGAVAIDGGAVTVTGGALAVAGGAVTVTGGAVSVVGGNVTLSGSSKLRVPDATHVEFTSPMTRVVAQPIRALLPPKPAIGGYFLYASDGALCVGTATAIDVLSPPTYAAPPPVPCALEALKHGALLTSVSLQLVSTWSEASGGGVPFATWDWPGMVIVARPHAAHGAPAFVTLGTLSGNDVQALASAENGTGRLLSLACACAPVAGANPIDTTAYSYFAVLALNAPAFTTGSKFYGLLASYSSIAGFAL
jgi:hypothetical protein